MKTGHAVKQEIQVNVQSPQILVVDDHEVNCELVDAMLSPHGYQILHAFSGREALDLCKKTKPNLVLLDVNMPGMDGFEVAKRLRQSEQMRMIPVVMVTALGDLDHRVKGMEAGADDYLTKPIQEKELLARVQSCLRLSNLRRQVDERKKLEMILGDVSDGIVIVDAKGRVQEVSPSARRLLTGTNKNFEGTPVGRIWGGLYGAPRNILEMVKSGEACDFEVERDDPPLHISVNLRPVLDTEGAPTGALMRLCDTTREIQERRLQQDFLSLVSHKFRTPLTVSALWVKILLEGDCGEISEEQRESLKAVEGATEQLKRLLDGMLGYLDWTKRLQNLHRSSVSLSTVETELRLRVQSIVEPPHEIRFVRDTEQRIFVDSGLLLESLTELVRNAVKFAGEQPARVEVRMKRSGRQTLIEVGDRGQGIPSEELERIFGRFYQVDVDFTGQVEGLGLGLSMVRRSLTDMGARLEVESHLGRGTTFKILF